MRKTLKLTPAIPVVLSLMIGVAYPEKREFPPPVHELTIDGTTITEIERQNTPDYLVVKDEARVTAENLSLISVTASDRSLLTVTGGSVQMVFATQHAQTTIGSARVEHVFLSNQSGGIIRAKAAVRSLNLSDDAEAVALDAEFGLITLDDTATLQIIAPIVQPNEGKTTFPGLEIEGGAIVLNSESASITSPAQSVSYCDGLVTFHKSWGSLIAFKVVVCDSKGCRIPEALPDQIRVHPAPRRPPIGGTRQNTSC